MEQLIKVGLDLNNPVVLISEMVVSYLKPEHSKTIFDWLHKLKSAMILYEAVKLDDAFGRIMVQNIGARGLELPGIYSSL